MHRYKSLQRLVIFATMFLWLWNLIPTVYAGWYTNVCGGGIGSTNYTCSANCSVLGKYCSGAHVFRFVCDGQHNECGGGGASPKSETYSSNTTVYLNAQCNETVQIDVFSKNCRAGGGWNCSSGDLKGYIVYYEDNCTPTGTPTPTPPICTSCNSYNNCQSGTPATKWRQTPQTYYGSWRTCYNGQTCGSTSPCNCPSDGDNCQWTHYYNSAPTCSISLDKTTVSREDTPINMTLNVSDADYGDTVEITGYSVSNYCAQIRTLGGTALSNGIVVKAGSDNSSNTFQSNTFVLNQQVAHGVFNPVGANSLCQATVTVQITDRIGDAGDSQSTRTCSASFTVQNQAPQLQDVELLDLDPVASLRKPGDQINGQPTVWVSSQDVANRPQRCSTPVDLNGTLPPECTTKSPIVTKTNPFQFSFTVSDGNGAKDLNYASIWLQRSDIPNGNVAPQYPVVSSGTRRSFAAMYSDYNDRTVVPGWSSHWITRADLTTKLSDFNKLSGLRLGNTGIGSSSSPYQTSTYREWQTVGFPDCLDTSEKCTTANVPNASKSGFGGNVNSYNSYIWDSVANGSNYICYDNTLSPKVTSSCDNSCAACIRRSQTTPVQEVNANTLKYTFELLINESLNEGLYAILLQADDKVGASLNNGATWGTFNRNGAYIAGGGTNQFHLGVDKTPPVFQTTFREGIGDEIIADVSKPTDGSGSGFAGIYRVVYYKINPTTNVKSFLTTLPGCVYDGSDGNGTCLGSTATANGFSFTGYGVRGKDLVHSYVCAYDVAGNGGCRRDDMNPEFQAADKWMKTSLGSIYTNTSISASNGFEVQLPSYPVNLDSSQANDILYAPFSSNKQQNSIVSHFFVTGASGSGVSGGNQQRNAGMENAYRKIDDANNVFNKFGIIDNSGTKVGSGGWYNRLLSVANFNCPILRTQGTTLPSGYNSSCQPFAGSDEATLRFISDTTVENKLITMNIPTGTTLDINSNLVCKNNNMIFIASGILSINAQLTKSGTGLQPDNCTFVVASGATLQIGDIMDNQFSADVDRFEGSVIADGDFITPTGVRNTNLKYNQLQIHGLVYMSKNAPQFKRDLVFSENRNFPSEWLIYDAQSNDSLRDILGVYKYSEIKCGASSHPVCGD